MKNALVIALSVITLTGCSMTPETRQRWGNALLAAQQSHSEALDRNAYVNAHQQRRLVPASCSRDYQNRLVCTGARYE